MEETMLVSVPETEQRLIHVCLHNFLTHRSAFVVLHDVVEVLFHILKHKMQIIVNANYLLQLYNVGMTKFSQRFHFPQRHALFPTEELFFHGLDGDNVAGLLVGRLLHITKGARAYVAYDFIFVHY
jgi:hypothetical protein